MSGLEIRWDSVGALLRAPLALVLEPSSLLIRADAEYLIPQNNYILLHVRTLLIPFLVQVRNPSAPSPLLDVKCRPSLNPDGPLVTLVGQMQDSFIGDASQC